jgi:hypothetical protein
MMQSVYVTDVCASVYGQRVERGRSAGRGLCFAELYVGVVCTGVSSNIVFWE